MKASLAIFLLIALSSLSLSTADDSENNINGKIKTERYNCTDKGPLICENIQVFLVDTSTTIHSDNFEMTSVDRNEAVQGFYISQCNLENYHICAFQKNEKIKFLPINFWNKFPNLVVILAEVQMISRIRRENFMNLSKLRALGLSKNEIAHIEQGSFDDLTELKELSLSNNKLGKLNESTFRNLKNLKSLRLRSNGFTTLSPKLFENLMELKDLDISANSLEPLDENLFKSLVKIEEIRIEHCDLLSLPEKLFNNLHELKTLKADHNELTTLPLNLFANNINLVYVSLDFNKITKLSYQVFENLSNLAYLTLRQNTCIDRYYGHIWVSEFINEREKQQMKEELDTQCPN
jgi:Leucine-rich repeat (LRR) protein